jgi:DNA invertase Pin-like site-specific DNA recombinase
MNQYVAYYRVFTAKQGHSGLGLEAQRTAMSAFVHNGSIPGEFVEVESGKVNNRLQLVAAICYA